MVEDRKASGCLDSLNEDYPSELKKDNEQQKKKGGSPGSKGKTGNGGKSTTLNIPATTEALAAAPERAAVIQGAE
jgi:hypothetical protein